MKFDRLTRPARALLLLLPLAVSRTSAQAPADSPEALLRLQLDFIARARAEWIAAGYLPGSQRLQAVDEQIALLRKQIRALRKPAPSPRPTPSPRPRPRKKA